jgi:hypothetical protein
VQAVAGDQLGAVPAESLDGLEVLGERPDLHVLAARALERVARPESIDRVAEDEDDPRLAEDLSDRGDDRPADVRVIGRRLERITLSGAMCEMLLVHLDGRWRLGVPARMETVEVPGFLHVRRADVGMLGQIREQ